MNPLLKFLFILIGFVILCVVFSWQSSFQIDTETRSDFGLSNEELDSYRMNRLIPSDDDRHLYCEWHRGWGAHSYDSSYTTEYIGMIIDLRSRQRLLRVDWEDWKTWGVISGQDLSQLSVTPILNQKAEPILYLYRYFQSSLLSKKKEFHDYFLLNMQGKLQAIEGLKNFNHTKFDNQYFSHFRVRNGKNKFFEKADEITQEWIVNEDCHQLFQTLSGDYVVQANDGDSIFFLMHNPKNSIRRISRIEMEKWLPEKKVIQFDLRRITPAGVKPMLISIGRGGNEKIIYKFNDTNLFHGTINEIFQRVPEKYIYGKEYLRLVIKNNNRTFAEIQPNKDWLLFYEEGKIGLIKSDCSEVKYIFPE